MSFPTHTQQFPITIPQPQIEQFCQNWNVIELSLFGSILRDDFRPDSDIDILIQFHPDAHPRFSTLDQMEIELMQIFDRDIDLITRNSIETSLNYLRRHEILSSARTIYATRSTAKHSLCSLPEVIKKRKNKISKPL